MRRLAPLAVVSALLAAACAGNSSSAETAASVEPEATASAEDPAAGFEQKGPITEAEDMPPAADTTATTAPLIGVDEPETTVAVVQEAPPVSDLPAVEVIDLAGDTQFNVASLIPSDRPILLWFWAPH